MITSEIFFFMFIWSPQSTGKGSAKMMTSMIMLMIAEERYGACAVVHVPPGIVLSQLKAMGLQVIRFRTILVMQYPQIRKTTLYVANRKRLLV